MNPNPQLQTEALYLPWLLNPVLAIGPSAIGSFQWVPRVLSPFLTINLFTTWLLRAHTSYPSPPHEKSEKKNLRPSLTESLRARSPEPYPASDRGDHSQDVSFPQCFFSDFCIYSKAASPAHISTQMDAIHDPEETRRKETSASVSTPKPVFLPTRQHSGVHSLFSISCIRAVSRDARSTTT